MSKLLPTPESSFVLDHYKDDMEVVDLVQGAGIVEEGYDQEDVDVVQRAVAQEYDDLLEQVEGQKYGKEDGNLVGAGEHGYEEDEEEVDLEQAPREQEMTHSLAEVIEGDILQEKPINTTKFVATSIKVDGRNNVPPEGTALSREDVFYGQDSIRIYNEEPLEQDKLMLEVLKGTGMKNMLNDATNNMDIYKQKPVVEEKQLKEVVEGDATMIELNVNDINEPGSGYSYQARVYDAKNGFALLKEKSDEMERGLLMMSYMDGEARNETQEQSISQGNDNYACQSVKKKQKKIIEHSHEGGYKADTANYLQVDDLLSVKGTEARNERLIIEDMNEKPVIELRQVIVSVHRGKIAPEHKSEDVKECSKSQKIVLVAKKVIEEIVGDPNSVVECKNALGDMNLARREIADECGLDLFDYRAGDHDSYNDFNISQENEYSRSSMTDDVADLPVLRVSTKVTNSKHINPQAQSDLLTTSTEELLNEERIWEQIAALRAIVGYSAPMHTTSVEEIKALYSFIGVEPPPSFADSSDLVEVNEKLGLLKLVVGIK